jgi:hypothetical protein
MPAAVGQQLRREGPVLGSAGQFKAAAAAWACLSPFAAIVTTRLLAVRLLLGIPNKVFTLLLLLLPCMLLPTLGRLTAARDCWEEKASLRVGNRTLLPIIWEAMLRFCGAAAHAVSVLRRQSPHASVPAVF